MNYTENFHNFYYYGADDGLLYHIGTSEPVKCWFDKGYRRFRHEGKSYKASRVVYWLHFLDWPEVVDHIDGNRSNDKIQNLRATNRANNNKNVKLRKNNTTGVKGVSFKKKINKYQVLIQVDGKNMYFGVYSDLNEAEKVARKWREELHGEFARHE